MLRGAINGVPVWLKLLELTGNERTVIKEAPGVDGATIETQGQGPRRYRVEFTLIQDGDLITDDVETAGFDLISMLLDGGPFTLEAPEFGEITGLWLEPGGYTINWLDETQLGIKSGSLTLVEGEPFVILSADLTAGVQGAISGLSEASTLDFASRVPDVGIPDQNALDVLNAMNDWLDRTQARINAAFQPVNDVAGDIEVLRGQLEQLLTVPDRYASRVTSTCARLASLVPSLSQQGDPRDGSAAVRDPSSDKAATIYVESLDDGATFDQDVPTPQGEIIDIPSEEDEAEIDEGNAARSLAFCSFTIATCLAILATDFATANSVIGVASALEPVFARLFALPNLDYRVYGQAQVLRTATLKYLSQVAASLPRLRTFTTPRRTDPFDILPDLYSTDFVGPDQVQAAVNSLFALNTLGVDYEIPAETALIYLDPLVV
jgi:hypothetical protein